MVPGPVASADTGRIITTFNEHWEFLKGPITDKNDSWLPVTIPHTWNVSDPFDDEPGYYRGEGNYRKQFNVSSDLKTKKYFVRFEAVNQKATVFVNGKMVGEHMGGYTAFTMEVTSFLHHGTNEIIVRVSNENDPSIPPLKGDFNFYGGIYRDVYLVETAQTHFDLLDHGSEGVFFDYLLDRSGSTTLNIRSKVTGKQKYSVVFTLLDDNGNTAGATTMDGNSVSLIQAKMVLKDLHLWSPDDPYLYTLRCEISDEMKNLMDDITLKVGFRTIRFDPNFGCFINDQPYKLHGVNRHQDRMGYGNALTNEMHVEDIRMIKSLGATFLRTAHYPQDPAVLDACDKLGIVVSMEIPVDHDMTNSASFKAVSSEMMREMIRQNRHHPSIAIWAYMNEMFLGKDLDKDGGYVSQVVDYAGELNRVAKREDPSRHTMIANHGSMALYAKSGLVNIPDIVGWNLYHGWYGNDCMGLGGFLDSFHKQFPLKPVIVTEFGAGSDVRIHSAVPRRFDYSIEWQDQYFECTYKQLKERTYLVGSAVWNMFDFGAEQRNDAIPHLNQKGLCTFDRTPKQAYYVVKAQLSDEPFVKIISPAWVPQSTESGNPVTIVGTIGKFFLTVNGQPQGEYRLEDHALKPALKLQSGLNTIEIQAGDLKDTRTIEVVDPAGDRMKLHMNLGADFSFTDDRSNTRWMPQAQFSEGYSGVVGGEDFNPRDRGVGSDQSISETELDPIYQTVRTGLESFKCFLVPGEYVFTFLLAELDKGPGERVFDIYIDGKPVAEKIDVAMQVGKFRPLNIDVTVPMKNDVLTVEFKAIKGEPMLNAIQVVRK